MAKIVEKWTKQAIEDLNSAYDFLSAESPHLISTTIEGILSAIDQVKIFPESGRPGRVKGTRELVVTTVPFILVYRKKRETLEILSILHQSRKWP